MLLWGSYGAMLTDGWERAPCALWRRAAWGCEEGSGHEQRRGVLRRITKRLIAPAKRAARATRDATHGGLRARDGPMT